MCPSCAPARRRPSCWGATLQRSRNPWACTVPACGLPEAATRTTSVRQAGSSDKKGGQGSHEPGWVQALLLSAGGGSRGGSHRGHRRHLRRRAGTLSFRKPRVLHRSNLVILALGLTSQRPRAGSRGTEPGHGRWRLDRREPQFGQNAVPLVPGFLPRSAADPAFLHPSPAGSEGPGEMVSPPGWAGDTRIWLHGCCSGHVLVRDQADTRTDASRAPRPEGRAARSRPGRSLTLGSTDNSPSEGGELVPRCRAPASTPADAHSPPVVTITRRRQCTAQAHGLERRSSTSPVAAVPVPCLASDEKSDPSESGDGTGRGAFSVPTRLECRAGRQGGPFPRGAGSAGPAARPAPRWLRRLCGPTISLPSALESVSPGAGKDGHTVNGFSPRSSRRQCQGLS